MFRSVSPIQDVFTGNADGGLPDKPVIRRDFSALVAGSAIWMLWSVLAVLILDTGYPFSFNQLFSLIAIAGLSGACMRLVSGYLLYRSSFSVVWLVSLVFLMLPLLLLIKAFSSLYSPFWLFQLAAVSSGVGAVFFPLRTCITDFSRSTARVEQEVRSALADSGLILAQVLLPVLGFLPLTGWQAVRTLEYSSSHVLGRVGAGAGFWIVGALSVFFLVLMLAIIRSLPAVFREQRIIYSLLRTLIIYFIVMLFCLTLVAGFAGVISGVMMSGLLIIAITLFTLQMLFSRIPRGRESGFLPMLANRKLQLLSLMHLMGAGSLLGFSASLPLLGKELFDLQRVGGEIYRSDPLGVGILTYIWLLPVIAIIARGISAWVSRSFKPEKINQFAIGIMLVVSLVLAASIDYLSEQHNYGVFFMLAMTFFIGAGLSSGSVFYQIVKAFPPVYMQRILIWISGVSSFGVFYIANMFASQHGVLDPDVIIYGFSVFYVAGFVLNWFFFLRRHSEMSF